MTLSVSMNVNAPDGKALELISCERGVETNRTRHTGAASVTLHGSHTIVMREVDAASAPEQTPGETRHGDLEPGDFDRRDPVPMSDEEMAKIEEAHDALMEALHGLFDLPGYDASAYDEAEEKFRAYVAILIDEEGDE